MDKNAKSLEPMENKFDKREDFNIYTIYNQCNSCLEENIK